MKHLVCFLLIILLIGATGQMDRPLLKAAAATLPADETVSAVTPRLRSLIREKKKINNDALGWLLVPGTNINDVIVQNPQNNNAFYLTHGFNKEPDKDGIFCADRRCELRSAIGLSRNTTLYGHSWSDNADGILFEQTKRYLNADFARKHPYIFFSTLETNMAWEVFAVYYTTTDLPYIIPDLSWKQFGKVLEVAYASSLYNYRIVIDENDKILTLSTCTYSVPGNEKMSLTPNKYRYVIMARLVTPDSPLKKTAAFSINKKIMKPDSQPHIENDSYKYR